MSPLEITLLILVVGLGTAVIFYHREVVAQGYELAALRKANGSHLTLTNIITSTVDQVLTENRQLRETLRDSVPDVAEDAAVVFDTMVAEAIEVTKEQVVS